MSANLLTTPSTPPARPTTDPDWSVFGNKDNRNPLDPVYQWYLEHPDIRPLLPENGYLTLKDNHYLFQDKESLKELLLSIRPYNPEQLEAIVQQGNLNILATAGSGKTTVLSSLAYTRIICGVHPSRLAVSSFTTTAAQEITDRTTKLIHDYLREADQDAQELEHVKIQNGTFHSLALQELRNWKWARGVNSKILDPYQVIALWREATGFAYGPQVSSQLGEQTLHSLSNLYDLLRNLGVEQNNAIYLIERIYLEPTEQHQLIQDFIRKEYPPLDKHPAGPIIRKYEEIKAQRNLLDYTDLLTEWLNLINKYPEAYRGRWEYFLVDEFQDTSPLQQAVLEKIHELGATIVTCGDPSQCINSFNGSDPTEQETLTQRIKSTPLKLTYNYRSSIALLDFANKILAGCVTAKLSPASPTSIRTVPAIDSKEETVLQIRPRPDAPPGIPPDFHIFKRYQTQLEYNPLTEENFKDETVQAELAAETITLANQLYWELKEFIPNPTIAILYRTNEDGDALEKQAIYHTARLTQTSSTEGTDASKAAPKKKLVPLERRDKKKTAAIKSVETELMHAIKFWLTPEGNRGKYFLTQILRSSLFPGIGEVKATALVGQLNCPIADPQSAWTAFQKRIPNRNTGHMGYFLEAWEQTIKTSDKEGHSQLTCTATAQSLRQFLNNSSNWNQMWDQDKSPGEVQISKQNTELQKLEHRTHQENFLASMEAMGPVPVTHFIQHREAQNESGRPLETENFQGIILATIHLAKGKEYDGVILHDVTVGKLPHQQSLEDKRPAYIGSHGVRSLAKLLSKRIHFASGRPDDTFDEQFDDSISSLRHSVKQRVEQIRYEKDIHFLINQTDSHKLMDPLEEERRLLYVAVTRPRHRLILTTRSLFGYPFL